MVRQDKPFNNPGYVGLRYIIKNEDFEKFEAILASNMMINCENKAGLEKIYQKMCNKINFYEGVDELVDNAFTSIRAACNTAFRISREAFN